MLEKIIALKEDFFTLKSKLKILVLTGAIIILLGGIVVSISYLSKSNKEGMSGTGAMGTTTSNTLQRPDWAPQTRDICGDGVCGITEKEGQNMCSKDCVNRPLAIDNFTATPSAVTPGQTAVLSWSSTASFCASSGSEDAYFVTGGSASGSVHTAPLQLSKTYTLSCMNNTGELQMKEVTVMVKSPTAKPLIKKTLPTITFTATPSTISAGQSTTLFWIVANATSCSASGGASWGWSGTRPTKGTQITPLLTTNQTYALRCTGENGSLSKSVTVGVSSVNAPSISLRVSPTTVPYGGKATLSWSISDAESCTTSNSGGYPEWSGPVPPENISGGQKHTHSLTSDQTFTITCTGGTGVATTTTTEEVTVVVSDALNCTTSSGEEIPSGSFVTAYQLGTVAYGETCVSEKRNCLNGKLSGSYTNQSCKVAKGKDCSWGGTTVKSGGTVVAYKDATVPLGYGTGCSSETRSCEDGTLSGSFTNQSCDVVYGNNDGPYIRTGACGNYHGGNGGNPDCTCGNGNIIAITSALNTCNFNSFASGGNNHFDCVFTCTLQPQKATSIQIANCKIGTDWVINCAP